MLARRKAAFALALGLAWGCAHRPHELRIYLARHGQTDWNAEQRLQGSADRHLNDNGRAQAAALARRLQGIRLDAVYSSMLARSRETAEIVHGAVPIESLPGLNERRMGTYEGAVMRGADPAFLAEFERRVRDPGDDLGGGETPDQFNQRVGAAVDEIRRSHPAGSILIVGHAGTNGAILRALSSLPADFKQGNGELYLVEVGPAGPPRLWKLVPTASP